MESAYLCNTTVLLCIQQQIGMIRKWNCPTLCIEWDSVMWLLWWLHSWSCAGLDWGGLSREFFEQICVQLFDASNHLFMRFSDENHQALVRSHPHHSTPSPSLHSLPHHLPSPPTPPSLPSTPSHTTPPPSTPSHTTPPPLPPLPPTPPPLHSLPHHHPSPPLPPLHSLPSTPFHTTPPPLHSLHTTSLHSLPPHLSTVPHTPGPP